MIAFFKDIYYRIYSWNYKNYGANAQPQFNAMVGVTFLIALNIITSSYLFSLIFGIAEQFKTGLTGLIRMYIIAMMVILFIIGYRIFLVKNNYINIVNTYNSETNDQRKYGTIKLRLYIFLSFVSPVIVVIIYRIIHC